MAPLSLEFIPASPGVALGLLEVELALGEIEVVIQRRRGLAREPIDRAAALSQPPGCGPFGFDLGFEFLDQSGNVGIGPGKQIGRPQTRMRRHLQIVCFGRNVNDQVRDARSYHDGQPFVR